MTVKIIIFKEKNVFVKCHIMSGETILNTCTHTHAQAYVHTNILTIHNLIYTLSNHNSEFIERFPRLKTLYNLHTNIQRCKGGRWCDVLGFVPAGSVSSFSTLQIFREASHLWGLLCPPVYLLGRFSSLRMSRAVRPQEFSKAATLVWTQPTTCGR